jgi:surface antigen
MSCDVTRAQLPRRTAATVLLVLVALLLPITPARAYTDDYAWRTDTTNSADPFGFTKRQCVSYAAWRAYKAGHRFNNRTYYNGRYYYYGNASNWDNTAAALHKTISHTPKVGAIAQWNAYEKSAYYPSGGGYGTMQAGGYGHVAWVAAVYSDGSVLLRQYNMNGNRSYSQMRAKAPRYLYLY